MPAAAPIAYATLSSVLPTKPYILNITPASSSPHLLLRHPSADITLADAQSLQAVDTLQGGHSGHVTSIHVDEGSIWSSAKDGSVVRWDERSRRPGMVIKAFVRKALPVLAVTASERDHLVIGGTELVSAEAHILFWDTRNPKNSVYSHASTHSDDITHLSLLPSTSSFLSPSSSRTLPSRLLLSSSTDGLVALSDYKESDEDEAVQAAENWGQSVAAAGAYLHKGAMKVWARSDMDGVALWDISKGEDEEIELQNQVEFATDQFRSRTFAPPPGGPSVVRTAEEERGDKSGTRFTSDYLIDVVPSLGLSKKGVPLIGLGSNEGEIVLTHRSAKESFEPSGFFTSGPGARGHKDVVRALHHDIANEAIYTGSEDGVLSGWSLASLPNRLLVGDREVDDDGGDGREAVGSDNEEDEESEIETEESDDDMDVDDDKDEGEGARYGPIIGGNSRTDGRKEKRREKRPNPY